MNRLLNDAELAAGLGMCIQDQDRSGAINVLKRSELGQKLHPDLHHAYVDEMMKGSEYLAESFDTE